jgi:hypothetical protein
MTFLELLKQFHRETGISGVVSTTSGLSGMLLRARNYIVKANRKIQRRKTNWKFLWAEWELTLTAESEYPPPDGIGTFDQSSFWLNAGTIDAKPLQYVDHKVWRDTLKNQLLDTDEPSFVTIKPNGKVAVLPPPSADSIGSIITCDYWRAPVDLANDTQVSLIPEQFHDIIVEQAKVYFHAFRHDTGAYNDSYIESEALYLALKDHSLPGREDDNKSESSLSRTIMVE